MLSKKAGEVINTGVCGVLFYTLKHFELQHAAVKAPLPMITFDIVA